MRTDDGRVGPSSGVRLIDVALIAYARTFEHPSKIRIARGLARRLAAGRIHVRYGPGAIVALDPFDYIGWSVFKTGYYEPESLSLALRLMRQSPGLFVDVGANFGWYTCAVAVVPGCNVISIEPDCENCTLLRGNILLGKLQNVLVFNGAAGSTFDVFQTVRRARGNSGTIAIRSVDNEPGPQGGWVATVPLESLLKRIVCPAARPVLMKVDVEGFEPQVLAGLDFDGPFRPRNILLEFDRQLSVRAWGSFGILQDFFAARGYELFDVFGQPLLNAGNVPEDNVWARDRKDYQGQ